MTEESSIGRPKDGGAPVHLKRIRGFAVFTVVLTTAFALPLLDWMRYAWSSSLHSYVLLVPFISAWLFRVQRGTPLPAPVSSPSLAVLPLALGMLALWDAWFGPVPVGGRPAGDQVTLTTAAYVSMLWAGALLLLGWPVLRTRFFPAAFLAFLVPLPLAAENAIEIFFQYTSADAASLMFQISGTTMFRDGLIFKLPGFEMKVAQECSGIRSSLILFITSLVAGQLMLRSPWQRAALTLFVIPLAIARNGFRVFTIGQLCVHVSPDMINSVIHKRGGPLFFALSLIPFLLFLLWLRRAERLKATSSISHAEGQASRASSAP